MVNNEPQQEVTAIADIGTECAHLISMHTWPTRVGAVLHMLDPTIGPRQVLERLWNEVGAWNTFGGIWLEYRPDPLVSAAIFIVGERPVNAAELATFVTPISVSFATDGLPVVARALRDGQVTVATLLVSHHDSEDAAGFLIDVLWRYIMDRQSVELSDRKRVCSSAGNNRLLPGPLPINVKQHDFLTNSRAMNDLIQLAVQDAVSAATVLIQGEFGTGKELLARMIHSRGNRRHKPMVSINASVLNPAQFESDLFGQVRGSMYGTDHDRRGLLEIADGGTLFIDEVGEMGDEAQTRLLRVLLERTTSRIGDSRLVPIDVCIIASTHRDLHKEVRAGRFSKELLLRLNVVNLVVIPLRERRMDIPLLMNHFLQRYNREYNRNVEEVPDKVMRRLVSYPWPGNVRELENCVHEAVIISTGSVFSGDLLPPVVRTYPENLSHASESADADPDMSAERILREALDGHAELSGLNLNKLFRKAERILITYALRKGRWIKRCAARELGINRVTLDKKLLEHHIRVERAPWVASSVAETRPEVVATNPPLTAVS